MFSPILRLLVSGFCIAYHLVCLFFIQRNFISSLIRVVCIFFCVVVEAGEV